MEVSQKLTFLLQKQVSFSPIKCSFNYILLQIFIQRQLKFCFQKLRCVGVVLNRQRQLIR